MKTSPDDISNEKLAQMIQKGFLEIHGKLDNHIAQNRKEHAEMMWKLSETVTRNEHHALEHRFETLEETRS